jgi:hypothetical protein
MIDVEQVPDPAASRIFVGDRFGCNPFMSREWLDAFSDRFRKPVYLRFLRDEQEVGFAGGLIVQTEELFHIPLNFRKIHFFTGPLIPEEGPKSIQSCLLALRRFVCSQNYWNIYLDCLDFPYDLDVSSLGYTPINRDEYIIDLHDDIDAILGRLGKNRRKVLHKIEKHHLNFMEITGAGKFESLVSCLQSTRRKKKKIGLGNYPAYYISYMDDEILKRLLESSIAKLYCIQSDETVMCSLLCIIYKKCSYALLGGTTKTGYELNANTLLYWETMKKLKETGVE